MEKSWTPEQLRELMPRVLARWPGAAALLRSRSAQERLRLATRSVASTFETLPSEIVMLFAEHLAPTNIQPYLDEASMRTYKEAQNSLRNLGLVSKRMSDVAHPYLYRGIIVDNSDTLVWLVRTLAEYREGLGQHTKRLVLQVPFDEKDENFRNPDLSIFLSSKDTDLSSLAMFKNFKDPDSHFWWELGKLYFHILKWTTNLEKLSLGMPLPRRRTFPATMLYLSFWEAFYRASTNPSLLLSPFLSKLTTVRLLGADKCADGQIDTDHCRRVFDIPSVRKLVCYRDNGMWFDLRPTSEHFTLVHFRSRGPNKFQYKNITTIKLIESACTPLHILDICRTFPCLQSLSVSTHSLMAKKRISDPSIISNGVYLSDGLARLPDLKSLELDLHYSCDFSHLLGPRGVLNLQALSGLQTVRVPLHFFVEKQTDGEHIVAYPTAVLPSSLRHLMLSADLKCVTYWRAAGVSNSSAPGLVGPHSSGDSPVSQYQSRIAVLQFLESVSSCISDYFTHLEGVTYCYGVEAQLNNGVGDYSVGALACPRQEAIRVLSPQVDMDGSTTRFGILSEAFDRSGIRFAAVEERVNHGE